MKPNRISASHYLPTTAGFAALVLVLLIVPQVRAQSPVPHDIVFLIDNSLSVYTGEGTPDGQPTDPAQVRLRLPYFVTRLLGLAPASAERRVGIISFAGSTETLMPLTPVLDWSKADLAEIRVVRHQGGTDFALALNAVSEMLAADCSPSVRRCDVVMVTDGIFERNRAWRDQQAVEDTLRGLHARGVYVHLFTFDVGDPKWQEFLTDDLISTYQPSVASASPGQVYGAVLRSLGDEALLTSLTPVEVVGEEVVSLAVPDFHTWIRYQILPDSPLTVTFLYAGQTVAPVVAGAEYTLFQPQAGEWSLRLQGNGLVYYRQAGVGVADLSLYLRAPEGALPLGEAVTVCAGITMGGAPVTNLTPFEVTATISGTTGTIGPLGLEPDETSGLFTITVPSDRFESSVYTVTLTAQSSVPNTRVQPVTGRFEVVALPTLAMTLTPAGSLRPGQSVHAIVTVANWRPGYVPRLQLYGPGGGSVVTPTWSTQGTGVFTSVITPPSDIGSSFAVIAQLAGGAGVPAGELFDSVQTAPQLVEYDTALVVPIVRRQTWLLVPLGVVLVIGMYIWWRFDRANKHRRRERRIKQLRDEVEVLARVVNEIPEEPSPIVESWNV
jgi:hypothetical protein